MPSRKRLEIGSKHGRLTITKDLGSRPDNKTGSLRPFVEAQCDCGNVIETLETRVRKGKTRSCGCLRRKGTTPKPKKSPSHGLRRNRSYHTWRAMMDRCSNPANKSYHNYGGRGITVCERWHSIVNFIADMGERPVGLTLERIDNDLDYTPSNCRWATRKEQAANTRKAKIVVVNGIRMPMLDAAKQLGYSPGAIRGMARRRKWTYQEAIDFYSMRPREQFHYNGRPKT